MKTAKKLIALLLSVLLCVSMVPSAFAAAVSYTAEVSPAELTVSDEDQTVTVTIKANTTIDYNGIGASVLIPKGVELIGISNEHIQMAEGTDYLLNLGSITTETSDGKDVSGSVILVLTYKIPANAEAKTYTLGVEDLEVTKNGGKDMMSDYETISATLTIKGAAPVVPVESVSLDKTELKLAKGGNAKLTATVLPADATDKTVTWTTSNDKVATVAADGTVTAVGEGTAVITATAGGKTAQCTVTVVNCLHTNKSFVAEKAATCTEKGMKAHYKCDNCSALFETADSTTPVAASTLELPMIDHTFTDVAEKAATCTEKGNVAYKHCSTCGKNYDAEGKLLPTVETPAKGHAPESEFVWANDATQHWKVCPDCNGVMTIKVDHTWDANGVCTVCKYGCNHSNGTLQWVAKDKTTHEQKWSCCGTVVKTEDHSWNDGVCTVCGYKCQHQYSGWKHNDTQHWKVCETCGKEISRADHQPEAGTPNCIKTATCQVCDYEVAGIDSKTHYNIVKVEAKEPTCTENGNIAHYKCTGCGKLFSDKAGENEITNIVDPAAHKLTPVAEKPSNCRVPGTAAYDKCDVCGKMFDKDGKEITAPATLPLAAHTWDTTKWLANKDGHYRECKVCGIADTVITPHIPGAEATETTPQTCTVCGYIIKPATSHKEHTKGNLMSDATSHWYACTGCSEQLEKANHTVTSWTVDKAATTTEEGLRHGNCSVCQHVVYEKLAKINNTPVNPSKPGRPSGTKTVQSGKTFDAGVGVYVGLSILSLTGSAVVIGKKRKTR